MTLPLTDSLRRPQSADRSALRWFGDLLDGQFQGKRFSAYQISQTSPGVPDLARSERSPLDAEQRGFEGLP